MNPIINLETGGPQNSTREISSSIPVEDALLLLKENEIGQIPIGGEIIAELLSLAQENQTGSPGQGMLAEGLFNFNGKLVTASIPQFLADELLAGKSFDANFSIPVNLVYEGKNSNNSLIFKIAGGQGLSDVLKAIDVFAESYSKTVESSLRNILSIREGNSGQSFFQGNISVSAKGNFFFINIGKPGDPSNFAISMVLTALSEKAKNPDKEPVKNESDKSQGGNGPEKIYMMTVEAEPANLGYIKLICVYSGKTLRVHFQKYSEKAKIMVGKNLKILKEMIESEGLRLGDLSFGAGEWKNSPVAESSYALFGTGGKIINERA